MSQTCPRFIVGSLVMTIVCLLCDPQVWLDKSGWLLCYGMLKMAECFHGVESGLLNSS